ncbi:ATP-binding cassette domain-containing protein [Acinetobacter baumannii]|uniref:ATP-binding cassette domain-containing protein n=1 Tax=Acinetobacter baumannii TaxID=470 RepID=UPI00189AB456|nr:ATP-binding cassette domain-containing protein [Acinetobacter baumannii]MBF6813612.1 ATP-binding cassette domain-containing protein [Acinetobacter baumannii]MBF6914164.1 ATP-binding cassette domain-containing protein [Acinetobacter baumannii]MBF6974579.1 ATP-binding cassette domain-containing protein [Acinetobacter baumannii]
MTVYRIDKKFDTEVNRSERVLEVAEAFGLGLDDKTFIVFDNLDLPIDQGDIVYITGQSGSGKSTILRELSKAMSADGLSVSDINAIEFEDKPLIDQIGKDLNEALNLLSIAGLNDAYLFIRKPNELSDGQRYRFCLAKLIESKAKVWVADEFLAVLDRTTAKVIAYNLQKIARKVGATVLVATTHDDMVEDLAPNVTIVKKYREKVAIHRNDEYKSTI